MDAAVPTYAGEILHSPAPSSIHVRLPGGGRLEAGPLSWLSVGADGEFALLEGALTASADPSGRLVVEVPGAVVTATGEVEVSARTPSGAKSAEGARWLGSWAAARAKDATPGTPEAPAPAAALVVYARRGPVEFAASPGPVRNSLERTIIPEGQALVVLEKKVYRVAASLEEAMPEQTGWLEGMPVPPGSKFFRGGVPAGTGPGPAPPPNLGSGGGPVRNSLERTLAERDREAERRAYALSVYDGIGGAEAIAAAAGAVDDPAVLVRSAAVRVLALNAWADRERAFVALRKLARDPDAGVARFAILAIKVLGDRGAIPDLKALVVDDDAPPDSPAVVDDDAPPDSPAVVDDDAPPEKPAVMPDGREYRGPRTVAQVYAFDALVYFGDVSGLSKAAELVPKVAGDRTLSSALLNAIKIAVKKLDHAEIRGLLSSEIPGIRAAAIRALGDAAEARKSLNDPSEAIRLAAAEVLLVGPGAVGFGDWTISTGGSHEYQVELAAQLSAWMATHPGSLAPEWATTLARGLLQSPRLSYFSGIHCFEVLKGSEEFDAAVRSMDTAHVQALAAVLHVGPVDMAMIGRGLQSELPHVRQNALQRLAGLPLRPESEVSTAEVLAKVRSFQPRGEFEEGLATQALAMLIRSRGSTEAFDLLMDLQRSDSPSTRQNAIFMLLGHLDRPEVCDLVRQCLSDSDERIAVAAARGILRAALDPPGPWTGPPLSSVVRESSIHPSADGLLALAAWRLDVAGSEDRFLDRLVSCGTSGRLDLLSSLEFAGMRLSRIEPQLIEDPSARVRIPLMNSLRNPLQIEVARRLRDDPFAWVRAVALAHLAQSGDSSADGELRELVRGALLGNGAASAGLGSPDRPDLAGAIIRMSGFAASVDPTLDSNMAPGMTIATEVARALRTARADALGRAIAEPGHPIRRVQLVRSLRDVGAPQSLRVLVRLSSSAVERDAQVRESCVEEALRFVGFSPREGLNRFLSDHENGFVTNSEITPRAFGQ